MKTRKCIFLKLTEESNSLNYLCLSRITAAETSIYNLWARIQSSSVYYTQLSSNHIYFFHNLFIFLFSLTHIERMWSAVDTFNGK